MEAQDGGHFEGTQNGDTMSPDSIKTKLQLPMSCDPPGPGNPPKQLVWIVSYLPIPKSLSQLPRGFLEVRSSLTQHPGLRQYRTYGKKPSEILSQPRRPRGSSWTNLRKYLGIHAKLA